MNISQSSLSTDFQSRLDRNGFIITLIVSLAGGLTTTAFLYFAYFNRIPQAYIIAAVIAVATVGCLYAMSLTQKGQTNFAMLIVSSVMLLSAVVLIYFVQGIGLPIASIVALLFIAFVSLALTQNYAILGVSAAFVFGASLFTLDIALSNTNRLALPQIQDFMMYLTLGIAVPVLIMLVVQFNRLSLQNKITLGILLTGLITASTISLFGLNRANQIVESISGKFEDSVTSETESQILAQVQAEASKADLVFSNIENSLLEFAKYRTNLENQKGSFTNNNYWNSTQRLFQLSSGQFGNSSTDTSSIFIPNTVTVNEDMLTDINTSIYLDFLAPSFLESHPQVVAVYYLSATGYTVYYPNTNLAQNVPADFDPRSENFYTIATPERNPERLPQWTNPYQDPAGTGPIITLSVPVYSDAGEFKGMVGADITLASIADILSNIQLATTDFAFIVDKNGFIISMPSEGYQVFGLEPAEISSNPTLRQSVFDTRSEILQFAAQRMIINQTDLLDIPVNGIDTYFAVGVVPTTDYKLVFFAPTDELNVEILNSRQAVQSEIQSALQNASLILITLFVGALVISLFVGQVITRPIRRLTSTVEQITSGDLNARAEIETQDEAGVLARSFNEMTDRLNNTLHGLEEKVVERTNEIEVISQNNAKRASQFESIARISRVISSTQTLDKLLPQIVQNISDEFEFYHVGIFLLDIHKEYAVLAAANSDGGKRMLERNHRLKVGETGIVGFVTRAGQPRIALDVGEDAAFFNNPDLPETRSEIALPLRIEAEIFGALDVQSKDTNAFAEEDVNILSVLADQVSIAIQNARSYQQSREALDQAELSAAQMIEQQWNQFLSRQNVTQYHFDGVEARQAITVDKQTHNLAIPLILRGAQIGTLRLTATDPNREWDEDEIAIAQATAERTALAIENARLLQEAQKRAAKEKTIGDISAKIGNLISLENILETTIQELGTTLPGSEVAIQFTDIPEQK